MLDRGMYKRCDYRQPSLSVNQSAGSLAVTKAFGAEVLGVTCCGGKERKESILKYK